MHTFFSSPLHLFVIVLIVLLAAPATAQVSPAPPVQDVNCKREVDEFTGNATISCDPFDLIVEEHPRERLTIARGMFIDTGQLIMLVVLTRSDSWNFLNTNAAYGLIDGERERFDLERIQNETSNGSVIEAKGIVLTNDQVVQLSGVNSFRMRIGGATFTLPTQQVNAQSEYIANN